MLSEAGLLYCTRRNFPETSIPSPFQSGEVPRITPSFTKCFVMLRVPWHISYSLLSTQFPGFLTIKSNIFKTALLQWVKNIQFDNIWRNKILILMFYFNICSKPDNNAVWILFLFVFKFSRKNEEVLIDFICFILVKQDVEKTLQSAKQSAKQS